MSSSKPSSRRLLELELPTTREDVEALRRARGQGDLSFAEALVVLSRVDLGGIRKTSERTAVGWEAFSLD